MGFKISEQKTSQPRERNLDKKTVSYDQVGKWKISQSKKIRKEKTRSLDNMIGEKTSQPEEKQKEKTGKKHD